MEAQKIQIGQRVQTRTPGKSGTLRGVVVGLDADHYHALVEVAWKFSCHHTNHLLPIEFSFYFVCLSHIFAAYEHLARLH